MIPRDVVNVDPTYVTERHYRINADTTQTTIVSASVLSAKVVSESHGFGIENYHRRVRQGDLMPHTPYERFQSTWKLRPGVYHRYTTTPGVSFHTDANWEYAPATYTPMIYDDITVPRAEAKLKDYLPQIQRAAANIYSQGHDALTFVAEFTKTVALFGETRQTLMDLLTTGLRGKTLEDSWLKYRYGWRTLYFDMVDIANALANLESERTRFSEKAGASSTTSSVSTVSFGTPGVSDLSMAFAITETKKVSLRGAVTADISPPNFRFNPAVTAWELMRFSFIIDWFINVGLWLEAMSFLTFATKYAASGGVKIDITRSCDVTSFVLGAGQTGSGTMGSDMTASYWIRIPGSVPTIPLINVRVDTPKFIDLWALVSRRGGNSLLHD